MQRLVQIFYMPIESQTDKRLPAMLNVHVFAGFGHEKGFGITVF